MFDSSALPETYRNLLYERAGVLFNLAAMYSQLGSAEDRSTPEGLKQAIKFYQVSLLVGEITCSLIHLQSAAGTFNHLAATAVPQLQASVAPDDGPLEMTEPFIRTLEFLMLAQAQECVWQRAVMGEYDITTRCRHNS